MMRRKKLLVGLVALLPLWAFVWVHRDEADALRQQYLRPPAEWPRAHVDAGVPFEELGPMPAPAFPADNPYSDEKALLGKLLFFDPRLSVSGQIACASCHDPELGWGDGRSTAFGHDRQLGKRNTMTMLNVGFVSALFWDGRSPSLEDQARFPIAAHDEMNLSLDTLLTRLDAVPGYAPHFRAAFGGEEITLMRVAQALATFERTIVSRRSRFDFFLAGKADALSDQEIRGLHLFRTEGRCVNCHFGPLLTDQQFHNNGFTFFGRPQEDLGRFHVTADTADVGAFRTPSLRDVVYTGPWMHAGNMFDLGQILDMYERGMPQPVPARYADHPLRPHSDALLRPLRLSADDKAAIIAFLGAVSARPNPVRPPVLP